MRDRSAATSRQVSRTRAAIGEAFQQLVFTKPWSGISMAEVARSANIGRSTLYAHFRDKDAIPVDTMRPLLAALAGSVNGDAATADVTTAVEHVWSHRDRGRTVLSGLSGAKLEAVLAELVRVSLEPTSGQPARIPDLVARQIAAALMAALRVWLRGEVAARPADFARHLCATSAALGAVARRSPPTE